MVVGIEERPLKTKKSWMRVKEQRCYYSKSVSLWKEDDASAAVVFWSLLLSKVLAAARPFAEQRHEPLKRFERQTRAQLLSCANIEMECYLVFS